LFDYTQLDLSLRGDVRSLVSSFQPEVIINTAAAVDVDWCEQNREQAWMSNVTAVEHLVEAARKTHARVVHVSTDYVFDGKGGPYAENDRPSPVNYYGRSKLAAENILLSSGVPFAIARVRLLFGNGTGIKAHFVRKVDDALRSGRPVYAAPDMGTNPTHAADAAAGIVAIVERRKEGIFHLSGADPCDRLTYARMVAEEFGLDATGIVEVKRHDLKLAAVRPAWTSFRLDKARQELAYEPMTLRMAVQRYKQDLLRIVMN
jgi:dTDP-4-dehydrorhamnose reductase